MEAIALWLKNPEEYLIGVQLYTIFGDNDFLKQMFANETAYNKKRLVDALAAILAQSRAASGLGARAEPLAAKQKPLEAAVVVKKQNRASDDEAAPPAIKRLVAQRKQLYNTSRDKFAVMKQSKDKDARKELAKDILLGFYEINKIWQITDYYDQKGEILQVREAQEEDLKELDTIALNKRFLTLYKYVGKYLHDTRKAENNRERIKQMQEIKQLLGDRGAFVHQNLTIPILQD